MNFSIQIFLTKSARYFILYPTSFIKPPICAICISLHFVQFLQKRIFDTLSSPFPHSLVERGCLLSLLNCLFYFVREVVRMFSKIIKPKNFVNVFPENQRFPRSIQNCILAPAAAACDICIVRCSAHPRGAVLFNRNEVSY